MIFAMISATSSPAFAGSKKIKSLDKDNVRAFIEDTSDITKGRADSHSPQSISQYLEEHLAEDARFLSTITYHIPDMEPQSTSVNFDKEKFIHTISEGAQNIDEYENTIDITEIKINWGGKKALVKTENTETGFMPMPSGADGEQEEVPIEGKSDCAQVITLNKGVIQMSNAVCKTDITFSEY